MTPPLQKLYELGTSPWLDSIRRTMIETGELERMVKEDSVVGVTSNPSIFEKAILGSDDYDQRLRELTAENKSASDIYQILSTEDVQMAADVLRPVYDRTNGQDGYVSLEVEPNLARDTAGTIASAQAHWKELNRPNVLIKIPGTPEGVPAIEAAIASGINVNVTLLFSLDAYEQIAQAYINGLQQRVDKGLPINKVASVASFFVSRVDTSVDHQLAQLGRTDLLGTAAVANAKLAYARFQELFGADFDHLRAQGATPQRVLFASTGTKNPQYSDTKYVAELAGPDTVNTMPEATLQAFQDHGKAQDHLTGSAQQAQAAMDAIAAAGVSITKVTDTLLEGGIKQFADAMDQLLAGVERSRRAVLAGSPRGVEPQLTEHQTQAISKRCQWAQSEDLAQRIWSKDYTLWSDSPEEITNRLGWLTISEQLLEQLPTVLEFVETVRARGFTDCVLLGMGGSSLAPEVLRRTFGNREGYLKLHVLDTTSPDTIAATVESLTLDKTFFIVSSKSGGTLETLSLSKYFHAQGATADQFAAITDPGTDLDKWFQKVFCNAPDIGGRYSALSYFGMVPAALAGIDVKALLESAEIEANHSSPSVAMEKSRGLWLGLAVGELARQGRNKLTFVVGSPLDNFGLWAEQLVAESTGKSGTGIVPIADEPVGDVDSYGDDRVFAYLRNSKQPDLKTDQKMQALHEAGHPVLTVNYSEATDLGGQFFLWEFAIAVAGAVLQINAFNQPNVQEAKDLTGEVIAEYKQHGHFPNRTASATDSRVELFGSEAGSVKAALQELTGKAISGKNYFATQAYVPFGEETDAALTDLRLAVRNQQKVATTVGYGPRFLHSTGQLHKGGPAEGVFLQITCDGRGDQKIPTAGYDFGTLIHAQALGDLTALQKRNLPVLTVHIKGDVVTGIKHITKLLTK